ncbi:MAG: two-component system sensor histidine kinase CreC [Gammaproteobacteria bacterium]|nr:two-component system sensor histidine kinase CreC [Gammaproteobacteria bacterium]MBQ0774485.1 two-component system sensor histidine kinase CreC [Gammaproteobacteria bacterium]
MKLSLRLLFSYFLIVGLMTFFLSNFVFTEVKPLLRQTVEETLVDSANMLAEIIAADSDGRTLTVDDGMRAALTGFTLRRPEAGIWTLQKNHIDMHVYITDAHGMVLFDSRGRDQGTDYSQWNDVARTLAGQYGARTTRDDPSDDTSSILYIAAPIYFDDRIVGVVSVGKPGKTIEPFAARAKKHLLLYGAVMLGICLAIGLLFTRWLAQRLGKVRNFALSVSANQRVPAPTLRGNDEVAELAQAVTQMKERLEGYSYVEQTVQMLVHEMKSPLSAIQGGSEILGEELHDAPLKKLANNIRAQSDRLKILLNSLLALARLEKLDQLPAHTQVDLVSLIEQWQRSRAERLEARALTVQVIGHVGTVEGDPELLLLALNNLLDNALDFADAGSTLKVALSSAAGKISVTISDRGACIPDYALDRLFERFYSLARPSSDQRGSGLGLSIVRQVMLLHNGCVSVKNSEDGVVAIIELPASSHSPIHS